MAPHSITEDELQSVKEEVQKRKEDHTPPKNVPISKDSENFQKAVEYLATKLFQSTTDEIYIRSHLLGDQIGASAFEVSPVLRTIEEGNVDNLGAEQFGSNQRCSTWRVYKDSDGS